MFVCTLECFYLFFNLKTQSLTHSSKINKIQPNGKVLEEMSNILSLLCCRGWSVPPKLNYVVHRERQQLYEGGCSCDSRRQTTDKKTTIGKRKKHNSIAIPWPYLYIYCTMLKPQIWGVSLWLCKLYRSIFNNYSLSLVAFLFKIEMYLFKIQQSLVININNIK